MTTMDARSPAARWARSAVVALAGARAALGVAALLAPERVARPWVGDARGSTETSVLGRALGGRDLALGLGALMATRRRAPVRGWVEAGALADLGDVAATLIAFDRLPRRGRVGVLALAGGAVVLAAVSAPSLSTGEPGPA